MRALEMYISGALLLILVFLVVRNASGTNAIIGGLSKANVDAIKALQGGNGF